MICVKIYMHQTLESSHSLEILLLGERKDRNICGFTVCSNWKNVILGFHRTQLQFLQCHSIKSQDSSVGTTQWFSTIVP
jgi:hypothetical protein